MANMLTAACLLMACVVGTHAARLDVRHSAIKVTNEWKPPKWYRGKDGPIFEIAQTLDELYLRRYEASKWLTTNITGATFDDAYKQGTEKLNDYWKGNNQPATPGQPGTKVDDTVPTIVLMYPTGKGRGLQTTFTVEYFLPHELQAQPPQPLTTELGILNVDVNEAWVREFGGYVGEKEVMDQAFGFVEQLQGQHIEIDTSVIAVAFYDDPVRLINRHNEIWVWAKPTPSIQAKTWSQRLQNMLFNRGA